MPRAASHAASPSPVPKTARCAIYTRKSTEEGLDRDFNSLDAQREAVEAYITSQRHEGWVALPDHYDDPGFTGANMERPALKRLLADIEAGLVDCVVVYKLDRLSRSMHDFFKIFEVFERKDVAFVSVTQAFNTTTPVGRMTMNILLSFAQFEREVIAERTRDKAHAARRRGKFTGGALILGYDRTPEGGRLAVNKGEAERVGEIFRLFIENPSLIGLAKDLNRQGWTLKRWKTREGRFYGGGAFNKHNLKDLLTNHTYAGKVNFRGTVYDAEHEAIVDRETWDRVQELLVSHPLQPRSPSTKVSAILAGLLRCGPCGCAMSPSYAQKGRFRYRYYVCLRAHRQGWDTCPSKSVGANKIESFVVDQIRAIGRDPELVAKTVEAARKQLAERMTALESDMSRLQKELEQAHAALRQQLGAVGCNGRPRRGVPADQQQEAVRHLEAQLLAVEEELAALHGRRIWPDELEAALEAFDPAWSQLTTPERAQLMQNLIERIDYDGRTGKLAISFRPERAHLLGRESMAASEVRQ